MDWKAYWPAWVREAYCVPDLQLDGQLVEEEGLGGELHPDGGLAVGAELLVQELHDYRTLADTYLPLSYFGRPPLST